MRAARNPSSRTARPRVARLVLLTVVAAAAHMSGVGHAGPPALVSGSVTVDVAGLAPIGDARNPSAIVVQAPETFAVTVGFVATVGSPLTFTRDSVVTLSVAAGGVALGALRTIVVPAGASTATLSGFSLSPAGNGVVLGAAVTGGSKDAKALQAGTSAAFDVLLQADRSDSTAPAFVTTDRGATGCVPTEVAPYCADVSLPIGTTHGYLVSVGTCDSVTCPDARTGRRVVQLLAGFPDRSGDAPAATIVFKCDKSKCKGGGVSSYTPLVQLEATGALVPAPSCAAKGVVTSAEQYCVDYVQSKRDGAGDLHMYVLFAVDVRGSCC